MRAVGDKSEEDGQKLLVEIGQVVGDICENWLYLLRLERALEADVFEENEELAGEGLLELAVFPMSGLVGVLGN